MPVLDQQVSAIPDELKTYPQWICWIAYHGDTLPHDPCQRDRADLREPNTWRTFDEALAAFQEYTYDGIGFVFSEESPYFGISLGNAYNPETETVEPWAQPFVQRINSYTEISPSGTGLHIIARGHVPKPIGRWDNKTKRKVTIRDHHGYFPFTGNHLVGTPQTIEERQEAITQLYQSAGYPRKTGHPVASTS